MMPTATWSVGRTVTWSSFNIPSQISNQTPAGIKTTAFWYNPEHERTKELQADQSIVITLSPRYDTGLHFEKRYLSANGVLTGAVEYEHYLYAGGLMFGKFITTTATDGVTLASTAMEYYSKDHLGSIVAITDGTGAIKQRLSYDVWGKRRYPNGAADPNGLLNNPDMYHGFTGHEMLDSVGLIHMNGRLYDPVMARFVSADFMIPDAADLQYYNRYSYVGNNPLSLTDASGQCPWCIAAIVGAIVGRAAGIIDTRTARGIIGIAAGAWMGPGFFANSLGGFGSAVAVGGITGGISSGWSGVGPSMLSAGLFYGAGFVGEKLSLARVGAHALAGCIGASATGGDCGSGALSAGFAQFAGPRLPDLGDLGNAMAHAIIGGTASVLGGGKFDSGAMTGAFGYLFNDASPAHDECKMMCHEVKYNPGQQMPAAEQKAMALEVLGGAATLVAAPEVVAGRIVGVVKEIRIEEKIAGQMVKRGWTESEIKSTVVDPDKVVTGLRDTRNLPGGGRLNDPATAYVRSDGHYVIRNDINGSVVQISNKYKPNWKSPF